MIVWLFISVVIVPSGFRGAVGVIGVSVVTVNKSLLSGRKKRLPVIRKSLLLRVGILFYIVACVFFLALYSLAFIRSYSRSLSRFFALYSFA